jgi:GNAT superfamily N-acetyltransferase
MTGMKVLTTQAIARNPEGITEALILPSGERIVFRALRAEDGLLLGRYFEGLSQETRRRFAPHPFTMEEAHKLCADIDYQHILRLIAVRDPEERPDIIAYFILTLGVRKGEEHRYEARGMPLESDLDCTLAPSVADVYQNQGVGSILMPKVLSLARRLGRKRVVLSGGTQATNHRAIHFYEKFGFRKVGRFATQIENYDMMLDLD